MFGEHKALLCRQAWCFESTRHRPVVVSTIREGGAGGPLIPLIDQGKNRLEISQGKTLYVRMKNAS